MRGLTEKAAELRRAFDLSFAEAPAERLQALDDLLAIRVGAAPYALRLSEVAGLAVDRRITPLPSAVPELLGLAGLRGAIVPVYDLAALLGSAAAAAPRWLAFAAGAGVALSFDAFERHLRLGREAVVPAGEADARRGHVREVLRAEGGARPIVHLASIVESIRRRAEGQPQKER